MFADQPGDALQFGIIIRRHFDHHVFSGWRALLRLAHLDVNAGKIGGLFADFLQDHLLLRALGVILQLDGEAPHIIDRNTALTVQCVIVAAGARIDGFDARHRGNDVAHAHHDVARLAGGKIAARRHQNGKLIAFARHEEFHALVEDHEQADHADHNAKRTKDHAAGPDGQLFGKMGIPSGNAGNLAPVSRLRSFDGLFVLRVIGWRLAEEPAQNRQEDQRHHHRRTQNDDQRHREIAHELSRNARPQQHGQKGADHGRGRAHHRPEHAQRRFRKGLLRRVAFCHFAVGIFHHDDRAIDQNADGEQHGEHDHEVQRLAEPVQDHERHQKRCRDCDADKKA